MRKVAGLDEAGRGPLAGPVVAAAVVFPAPSDPDDWQTRYVGLTDSKLLAPARRSTFADMLLADGAVASGLGVAEADEIDAINILRATHAAMARAVAALPAVPDHVLVDGLPVGGLSVASTAIVKGDRKSLSIAAASVIAKVYRDRRMLAYDREFPGYGFAQHKGYGSRAHLEALMRRGPCSIHRRSFRPVRESEHLHGSRG